MPTEQSCRRPRQIHLTGSASYPGRQAHTTVPRIKPGAGSTSPAFRLFAKMIHKDHFLTLGPSSLDRRLCFEVIGHRACKKCFLKTFTLIPRASMWPLKKFIATLKHGFGSFSSQA